HPARRTQEEPCPELGFERSDLPGKRGLRDRQTRRGTAEIERFGHGDEVAQMTELHRIMLKRYDDEHFIVLDGIGAAALHCHWSTRIAADTTLQAIFRSRSGAYGALMLTAALWGSSAVTARGLLDALPPVALAYLRWTVVLLLLVPFAWPERAAMAKALSTHFGAYATLAFVGFAPQTCLVYFGLTGSTATLLG